MSVSGPVAPSAATALEALRAAGESDDADAIAELLAPDVVFHSPMTDRIRFEGRDEVVALHRDIFAVLDDINTTEPVALGDTGAFSFRARVRGVELEAANVVRCNEQGQIVDMKVLVRPLPGLATLFATLPPRVFGETSRTPQEHPRGDPRPAPRRCVAHRRPLDAGIPLVGAAIN